MGISSFSTQYLPRNLRALSIVALFVGILYAWGGINNDSLPSLIIGADFFFGGIMFFSLASGVSKKEKWASVCGILLMGAGMINASIQFFLGLTSLLGLTVGIVIPFLLLISFIRSLKEIIVKTTSLFPFITTLIGFCLIIASWLFLIALVLK